MTPPTLLITGATGQVGGALLPLLAQHPAGLLAGSTQGHAVAGVPGRAVDFTRPDTLAQAFFGVEIAFIVIPLHPGMVEMAKNVARAAQAAGVKHLVRISGAGADPLSPLAIARAQGQVDQALQDSGVPCTFLRPKNFMQNFSGFQAGMIQSGRFYSSHGDGRVPFVDVRDIAAVAATVLKDPAAHAHQAYVLTGPEALTSQEAVAAIANATGRPVTWVAIPEAAAVQAMREMGMPDFAVDVMSSLNQAIAAGLVAEVTDTVQQLTGQPPRRFEDFVQQHLSAWQMA